MGEREGVNSDTIKTFVVGATAKAILPVIMYLYRNHCTFIFADHFRTFVVCNFFRCWKEV